MENSQQLQLNNLEKVLKNGLILKQGPGFADALLDKILARIEHERQLKALRPRLWASVISFAASLFMLTFAIIYAINTFSQTGLGKFMTLLFTDFGTVMANWQDYSYSILENLPIAGLLVLFGTLFASAWFIDFGARQFLNFKKLNHTTV